MVWYGFYELDHNPDDELFSGGFYACVDSTVLAPEMNNSYTFC